MLLTLFNLMAENNIDGMKMDFTYPNLCLHFLPTAKVTIEVFKHDLYYHPRNKVGTK